MQINKDKVKSIGRVVSVQGPVVDVKFANPTDLPNIFSVVYTETVDKEEIVLEEAVLDFARSIVIEEALFLPLLFSPVTKLTLLLFR